MLVSLLYSLKVPLKCKENQNTCLIFSYGNPVIMLTLQSSKSWSVCLLMFDVKQDSQGDVILLTSPGVSFTEIPEGLNVKREVSALRLPVGLPAVLKYSI